MDNTITEPAKRMTVSEGTQSYIDCLVKLNDVFTIYSGITNKTYDCQYDTAIKEFADQYHKLREIVLGNTIDNINYTLLESENPTEI